MKVCDVFVMKGTLRTVSTTRHVTKNEVKSLCGLPVAIVGATPPTIHNVGCSTCYARHQCHHQDCGNHYAPGQCSRREGSK